jgi:hypothetical protein
MKLLKTEGGRFVFYLGRREAALLLKVLKFYPLLPTDYHRVTRSTGAEWGPDAQRLLEESMAEHQRENVKLLELLGPRKLRPAGDRPGYRLALDRAEVERLLQILNDIRVGSWLRVGCPDPDEGKLPEVNDQNVRYYIAMRAGEQFECALIAALDPGAFPRDGELEPGDEDRPGHPE